jgi:aspartate/methionine/tyrosine aminotransferase
MKKLKFKDDFELVRRLLVEENVQVTRGSGFGAENHIRIVSLPPKEILEYAIRKIDKFLQRNSK